MNELTLAQLLAVEDDAALIELACPETRVPLWSAIRNPTLRFLMSDLVFASELTQERRGANFRSDRSAALLAMARAAAHNLRVRSHLHGEILITTGSAGLSERDGRWFNRLSDYFAQELPQRSVVLEDLFKWRWRWPRQHRQVLFHTPLYLEGQLIGRIAVRGHHREVAGELVGRVRERAAQLLGWQMSASRQRFLETLAARELAAMPLIAHLYRRLFKMLGVRVVLREMGCYGRSAIFNLTARNLGIIVAEHQHGLVSAGHDAYNFAPAILHSEHYRATLPEYFMNYGSWWGEQINAPLQQVTIGNPHRSEALLQHAPSAASPCDVLVLGDGLRTESYLSFARSLAQQLPRELRVVFRPHPLERAQVQAAGLDSLSNVHLDVCSDIYQSFRSARALVSEASTGLFEAVGLVERIFVLESPRGRFSLPRHPFASCTDACDLAAKLREPGCEGVKIEQVERIWAPQWRANYRRFLAETLRIEPAGQAV